MKIRRELTRDLRTQSTDTERRMWGLLRDRRLLGFKFRRQHPVGPYITDFCCLRRRLVIELDGGKHADQEARDKRRTAFLARMGFHVVRFWDGDVLRNPDAVLASILQELINEHPHPNPLPGRERGSEK